MQLCFAFLSVIMKAKHQEQWVLARIGKRILRPGSKELTQRMIRALNIGAKDHVVELAPGIGNTVGLILEKNPASYVGVERSNRTALMLRKKVEAPFRSIIAGDAGRVPLMEGYATKVFGEAVLMMQTDEEKRRIMTEAARLLRSGGLYAIHELCLQPDDIAEQIKSDIRVGLSRVTYVPTAPLTKADWKSMMEAAGFEVISDFHDSVRLLENSRILRDEGLFRSLLIGFNYLRLPVERKKMKLMKQIFRKYAAYLSAVVIVGRKI